VAHLALAQTDPAADQPPAPARVGFVVGGAVGPAVVRNTVRRRLRHLTVGQLPRLPDGTLLVLRALPAAAGASSAQLAADVSRVLERLLPADVSA